MADDEVLRHDQSDYTPNPGSVGLARRRAARLAEEWGYAQLADATALLTSELATNAVLHGSVRGRLFRVRLALTADLLRIAVEDAKGEATPRPRHPGPEEPHGRGLHLVRALASRWGTDHRSVGKTVWCELDLPG
ncbi:ATP-binding protein [Streptomyces sp. ODS28]|uniref:ATP-binding protein n=1 Tax=Streptomyces sp. ODS28 TaxID=3136688 RepID=UPI0031E561A6